jgi:hypothetical protein
MTNGPEPKPRAVIHYTMRFGLADRVSTQLVHVTLSRP